MQRALAGAFGPHICRLQNHSLFRSAKDENRFNPFLADERIVGMKVLLTGQTAISAFAYFPSCSRQDTMFSLLSGIHAGCPSQNSRKFPAGFRPSSRTCWKVRRRFRRMLTLLTISFTRWEVEAISQNARGRLLGILRRLSNTRMPAGHIPQWAAAEREPPLTAFAISTASRRTALPLSGSSDDATCHHRWQWERVI
jgi:hypothetical protein